LAISPTLFPNHLNQDPFSSATIELAVKDLPPRSEIQLAFGDGDDDFPAHNLPLHGVASARVRDDISAAGLVFAPEYGSEDYDQIRSHICRRDCAGSTRAESLATEA
jgi:hypothetical protein